MYVLKGEYAMRVMHLIPKGGIGGVESLALDIGKYSHDKNIFYFFWGGGETADRLNEIKCKVYVRDLHHSKINVEYKYFESVCLSMKIDCIIVHGGSLMILLFSRKYKTAHPKIRLFLYIHCNEVDSFLGIRGIWQKYQFNKLYSMIDGCIAISHSVRNSFAKCCDIEKMNVIYNAVDLELFCYRQRSINIEKPTLMYIGRLVPEKGVDLLIRAMDRISYDAELIIIGDGPSRNELEKLAEHLQVNISFEGIQTNVPDWLEQADLFIHPATWEEGFGITLIEAMATGCPCIAFRKGAIPEIITNRVDGFIVDNVSAEELAKQIDECIQIMKNDKDKWENVRASAAKSAAKYDVHRYVEQLSQYISSK